VVYRFDDSFHQNAENFTEPPEKCQVQYVPNSYVNFVDAPGSARYDGSEVIRGRHLGFGNAFGGFTVRNRFLALNPNDPSTAEAMRLEGTKKWVAGSQEGFQELLKALREEH
jgi:hypothetical protein